MSGHEVLAGDRFCGQCGWAVPAHCPYGHPAQPDHTYCRECGAAVDHGGAQQAITSSLPPQSGSLAALAATPPAAVAAAPASMRTGRWGARARMAALVAGVLVLGAAGLGAYAGATGGPGNGIAMSPVPGAIVSSAARRAAVRTFAPRANAGLSLIVPSTAQPPSTAPPSTAPSSTSPPAAPAAPAASAPPGLRSLTGDWTGHGGGLHIGADGQGQAMFRAYRFCTDDPTPPCDTMMGSTIVDGGHAQFRLTPSGAAGAATGLVVTSNDPEAFQPGFALTVSLTPGDVLLVSSSPTAQSVAYCGPRAAAGACGA